MIFVERDRVENGVTIRPNQAWFDRSAELRTLAEGEMGDHDVKDHYKADSVKTALEAMSHRKCVYCETRIGDGASWDVEHYRPKGAVAERANHPGYYWLAYEWTNLLPSCSLCNQKRKDPPLFHDRASLPAAGKLDQFPVDDEDHRAMDHHQSIGDEVPMLLNPTVDDPELYLTYAIDGSIQPIEDDPFATETIRILHLNRRRLKLSRAAHIPLVSKAVRMLRMVEATQDPALIADATEVVEILCADDYIFAGVARAIREDLDAFEVA
ncbi:MAG: retron system putative HNH endonuclease [Planctomycetota bacterium]